MLSFRKTTIGLALLLLYFLHASCKSQSIKRIDIDPQDSYSGHYLAVAPDADSIKGVLVLIAGFGSRAEDIFPETKLQNAAFANGILTVGFAAGNKLYADSITQARLTRVIKDVLVRYKVKPDAFVIGGYSAGGAIALRYVELCNEAPGKFPIRPRGVFLVDAPIDIFTTWNHLEESARTRYSEPAWEEAERAMGFIRADYGVPQDNIPVYAGMNAFSMNKEYGEPEKALLHTAVRAYHDVDIAWRLVNRNQTVHNSNYEVTAELINRLLLMGNKRAEFMQSFKTGYRADGQRHPHSWSIVDEEECIGWMKTLLTTN